MATQRYINPHGVKMTRTGAEPEESECGEVDQSANPTSAKAARLYIAGKRLCRGEDTKARFHPPQDDHGESI